MKELKFESEINNQTGNNNKKLQNKEKVQKQTPETAKNNKND